MAAVQDQAAVDFARSDTIRSCAHTSAHMSSSSLLPTEIPIKLRCATCSNLAVNAFKLQCCDSSICHHCQATLPEAACPICSHSPLDPDMCKPNKSLRLTIRAFIKNEEKKRSAAAEAATVTVSEPEETTTQPAGEPAVQPHDDPESHDQASGGQEQEEIAAPADASESDHAPDITDPLAQVHEVNLYPSCATEKFTKISTGL
jgi:hypothetical protein